MKNAGTPPKVAIASCSQFAGTESEDLAVIAALRDRGVAATHAAWDDPSMDWSSCDLVVVRSTWDYPLRLDEFLAWAGGLRRVLNPYPVLKWNTDKHYLDDLARAGLPVIPTSFLEPGQPFEPPPEPFVIKPAVSCGAKDTIRYFPDQGSIAREHVHRLHADGRTAMLQPYLADIERTGEVALICMGGQYSHAICRGALLQDSAHTEARAWDPLNTRPHEPSPAQRDLAARVMVAIPGGSADILYARIDIIPGRGDEPVLLEVELTEPTLFLSYSPGGDGRMADAIVAATKANYLLSNDLLNG